MRTFLFSLLVLALACACTVWLFASEFSGGSGIQRSLNPIIGNPIISGTSGNLLYVDASTNLAQVSGTATQVLHGGTPPTFSAVSATADLTGILPIANGGTNNAAAYTAGSIPFSNGTSLTQNNANLFWDNTNVRMGIGTSSPGSTAANGFTVGRVIEVQSATTSQLDGMYLRRSDNAVGLDVVSDNLNTGGVYFDSRFDNATNGGGGFQFRGRTNGTAVNILHMAGNGNTSVGNITASVNVFEVGGGVAIGTYAGNNIAPSNGLIVSGLVGIGKIVPAGELHVKGAGNTRVRFERGGAGSEPTLIFSNETDTGFVTLGLAGVADGGITGSVLNDFYIKTQAQKLILGVARSGLTPADLVINTSGNVGIGTTSPGAKLEVSGGNVDGIRVRSTNSGYIRLYGGGSATNWGITNDYSALNLFEILSGSGSADPTSNRFTINSIGNVGIGTTGPGSKLDVTTTGLGTTQTTSSGLALVNTTAAAAAAQQISPAIRWSGFGWKTDVTAASQAVDFRSYVVPVQGAANPTGYLSFGSSVNGAAYSDGQLVLTTGGNVGIGTTGPGTTLDVRGNVTILAGSNIRPTANSATALNIAQADGTNFVIFDATFKRVGINTTPNEALEIVSPGGGAGTTAGIRLNNTSASGKNWGLMSRDSGNFAIAYVTGAVDALTIDSLTRNVGIGQTSPGTLLDLLAAAPTIRLASNGGGTTFDITSTTGGNLGINRVGVAQRLILYGDGALELGTNTTTPGTYRLALKGGTATATTDWALTSGWGANATISAVTGNDSRGTVTVTTSALDTPGLNPVVTLTFKDLTWTTTPFCVTSMRSTGTGPLAALAGNPTATTLAMTFIGTPTALSALTYVMGYTCVG